jgi:glycosyltransferase involved in cell wall biosynthesis
MKVSVITVAYNSADTILDTICSVLIKDYPNIEYILVEAASKDITKITSEIAAIELKLTYRNWIKGFSWERCATKTMEVYRKVLA